MEGIEKHVEYKDKKRRQKLEGNIFEKIQRRITKHKLVM